LKQQQQQNNKNQQEKNDQKDQQKSSEQNQDDQQKDQSKQDQKQQNQQEKATRAKPAEARQLKAGPTESTEQAGSTTTAGPASRRSAKEAATLRSVPWRAEGTVRETNEQAYAAGQMTPNRPDSYWMPKGDEKMLSLKPEGKTSGPFKSYSIGKACLQAFLT
jgi:hypothetical protein